MRFVMMHKANKDSEAGVPPAPEVVAGIGELMQEMVRAGVMLGGEGLRPSSNSVRLNFSDGRRSVARGPFARSNGLIAGFIIIRTPSMDEAIDWASRYAQIVGAAEIDIGVVTEPWDIGFMPKPEGLTTTRYMIMRKSDSETESGAKPSPAVLTGIRKLTEEMLQAGVFISAEALQPSSKAVRLHYSNGQRAMMDGPFSETKELIGGYGVVQVASQEEALEWAWRFAKVVAGSGQLEIDVRAAASEPSHS